MTTAAFCELLQTSIPHVRAYARSLTRNVDSADDLVQDTLVRAWSAREQFTMGTNFKAWVFTILRNRFLDQRRRDREVRERLDDLPDEKRVVAPSQEVVVQFDDMARAFWRLSPHHREILMLVGANGLSYEEAAVVIGCAVGTVRSRLSRARSELQGLLERQDDRVAVRGKRQKGAEEFLRLLKVA
jgi:RNA polymerase sigma-70 factor, ECF subfamily